MDKESLIVGAGFLAALLYLSSSKSNLFGARSPSFRYPTGQQPPNYVNQQAAARAAAAQGNSIGGVLSAATNSFANLYKLFAPTPAPSDTLSAPLLVAPDPSLFLAPPSLPSLGLTYASVPPPDILVNYNPPLPVFTGSDPSVYIAGPTTIAPDISAGVVPSGIV